MFTKWTSLDMFHNFSIIYNLQFVLDSSCCWMDLKRKIVLVQTSFSLFARAPRSSREADPQQPPCSDFSDFARWGPARSKEVHRIPDLGQHTARASWIPVGTPRARQVIASSTRGWSHANPKWRYSPGRNPWVQEIARQRCDRQMGSDEN